jgi:hypothetical protein
MPPAKFGVVAPQDVGTWPTAPTIALAAVTDTSTQKATVTLPDGMAHIRLDFELVAAAAGHSATVLAFRQLFLATALAQNVGGTVGGTLLPAQFAIPDIELAASPNGPTLKKGPSLSGFKTQLGLHPLLSVGAASQFSVNTEFIDVTELWWLTHPDTTWGWYWRPEVGGRQEHLRVLAWTGGGNPMIWFAAITDAAESSRAGASSASQGQTAAPAADVVFFRPPPGSNSFPYSPTQGGFEARRHDDVTLVNLARYLLSPVPEKTFQSLKSAGLRSAELLADQVQPKSTTGGSPQPADPMSLMRLVDASGRVRPEAFTDTRANAFRPVGLEAAINRSGAPHVLFLPLGFDASEANPQGGYEAAQLSDLKATIDSALSLLWSTNAVGRDRASPPRAAERELWVTGHSAGNRTAWACVRNNATDVDRVISFDSDTLSEGIAALQAAGKKRPSNKVINAFVVITPANGGAEGLTTQQDEALRRLRPSQVLVTVLPDFVARVAYWRLQPPPITNSFIRYLLAKWDVPARGGTQTLLDRSGATPGNWGFLFFHELAVFGGDLVQQQPSSSTASPPPPRVKTFFESALGTPSPRPPIP